jgi:hypothetical protein
MTTVYQDDRIGEPVFRPDTSQVARAAAFGVAFWFTAALIIRYVIELGFYAGVWRIVVFTLTIPLTWVAITLLQRLTAATPSRLFVSVSIATGTAAFCDVVALSWFPGLYGSGPATVLSAAVLLLWGITCALALGCVPIVARSA